MNKKIVLIDLDNTIIDWNQGLKDKLSNDLDIYNRKYWCIYKSFDQKYHPEIKKVLKQEKFYFELRPNPDAIQTVKKLNTNYDVFFLTSPPKISIDNAILCKIKWINKYFGEDYLDKLIITYDKTLVMGDILIDDKPEISGCVKPRWKHILFTQSYNKNVDLKRINNWNYWDIIDILK